MEKLTRFESNDFVCTTIPFLSLSIRKSSLLLLIIGPTLKDIRTFPMQNKTTGLARLQHLNIVPFLQNILTRTL
jgi:hypothetical protein